MTKSIDERVVEMRFDNKHFESNVGTTLSTLEKLKQKLNFGDSAKAFDGITRSANKVDMSAIARAIEPIQVKFSALQVVADTALTNITNSAVDAGKKIVSMFTIDPISTGFSEYELKMGSVQTIMASTGESLETVNNYLEELNAYSDQTIYSFSDMTQNIGKFTNAGVGLNDAVLAIKGISNAAALSGANAGEASRAMYNFAQALSSGYVKLIDWKSIENANMATVGFKQQLIDAAVAAGTLTKVTDGYKTAAGTVISPTKNFNDSLQDQWMTTDVLINTLRDYADETTDIGAKATAAATEVKTFSMMMDTLKESAQSGWAQTWELIIGDFEEAKSFFTYLTNNVFGPIIDGMSDARNNVIKRAFDGIGSERKWDQYVKRINEAGVATEDFQNELLKTAKTYDKSIAQMIKDGASFEDVMKSGKITSEMIAETLWNFIDGANEASVATADMTDKLKDMRSIVNKVIMGDFGNGADRIKALTDAGYEYAEVQALVNKVIAGGTIELSDLSEEQLKSAGYTEDQIRALKELAEQAEKTGVPIDELVEDMNKMSGREMVIETIKNVCEQLSKVLTVIKEAWAEVFGEFDAGQALYDIIEAIYEFVGTAEITEQTLINLKNAFKGLFDALWLVKGLAGGVFGMARKVLSAISYALGFGDIWQLIGWIGQMVSGVKTWVTTNNVLSQTLINVGNSIKSFVENTIGKIRELIEAFLALEEVQLLVSDFRSGMQHVLNGIGGWFTGLITIVGDFANKLLESLQNGFDFEEIKSLVKEFFVNLGSHFSGLVNLFRPLIDTVKKFAQAIAEHFGSAGEAASGVFGTIFDKISGFVEVIKGYYETVKGWLKENVSFGSVLSILLGGGMIFGLLKVAKALDSVFSVVDGFRDSFGKAMGGLKDMFKDFGEAAKMRAKAESVKTIAIAVAILAAALFVVGHMEWEEIGRGLVAMAGVVALLIGVAFAISKMGEISVNFAVGTGIMLTMAAALLILVGTMKLMESLDGDLIGRNLLVLAALVGGLVVFVAILSKTAPQLSAGSFTLIAFALAITTLVYAFNKLSSLKIDNVGDTILLLLGIVGVLTLVSVACKGFGVGTAVSIIAVALSLKILVSTLNDIANLDANTIKKNMGTLIAVLGMFALLMVASGFAGANALKGGLGIIAMSMALMIIVGVIKMMADINPKDLAKATGSIAAILLVFGAVVALSHFAGKYAVQAGAMLMLMSAALLILSGALVIISYIKPDGLDRAVEAISKLIFMFGLLVVASHWATDARSTVIAMSIAIGMLVVAIGVLSMIDPARLAGATVAISIVIGVFAGLLASTKYVNKAIGTIIVMTTAVALLAGILWLLADIPYASALGSAAALSILLLSLSASMNILCRTGKISASTLGVVYALVGVVALLAGIIGVLAYLNVGPTLEIAASLSILLLALATVCHVLTPLGATGPMALKGAAVLAGVIAILTATFAAIGGLVTLLGSVVSDEAMDNLDRGIEFLKKIAFGFGEIVGSVVGGLTSGLTSGLADLGTNLSDFMTNLKPFLDGAKTIDESSINGVKTLAETLLILTGANLLDRIASFGLGGKSLAEFAEQLVPFGESLAAFSKTISGNVDSDAVTAAANAGKMLAEMADTIPNFGGIVSAFIGDNDMATFGNHLTAFGQCIAAFSTIVSGKIDEDAIVAAANSGKVLAELANAVPNFGGIVSAFTGDNDLATFGNHLTAFGQCIVAFSTIVAGKVDESSVVAAANAGKVMAELANTLPNFGGIVSAFTGDNDIATFGNHLVAFGQCITTFSMIVSGKVDEAAVTSAANAGRVISELANTIPNTGGLAAFFAGDNNIAMFGHQLTAFGQSIADFSTAVSGKVDSGAVTTAAAAGKALVELATILPEDKLLTNELHLDEFGDQLTGFGRGLAGFYVAINGADTESASASIDNAKALARFIEEVAGLDTSGVGAYKNAVNELAKTNLDEFISTFSGSLPDMSNVGSNMIDSVVSGFQGGQSSLTQLAASTANKVVMEFSNKLATFTNIGITLMNGIASGMVKQANSLTIAVRAAIVSASAAAMVSYTSFYSAGTYLGSGLVAGINSKKTAAYNAGYALGQASAQGVKDGEDAHSPSREGIKAGKWLGEGVIIGIKSLISKVYTAGHDLGKTAVDSMSNTISRITDVINSDVDAQPTIRPVLDLSDVESGAGMINSMLGGLTPSAAVLGSVGGINSAMNRRIQNGVNSDVVSAIDKLRKDVGNLENRSYSIGGISYGDDSAVANAIETLVRAVRVEGRV